MHITALQNCHHFFDCYADAVKSHAPKAKVIEIGSQDINGSIRICCPTDFEYIGVDFAPGKGVDLILEDPYTLPFPSESIDIILSSSCFEHSEMFWVLYIEIMRVLKPSGLFYLNVPSNGFIHQYPVDCWRFYPDSGRALVAWAKRNNIKAELLESYTSRQDVEQFNDFVAVFIKDEKNIFMYPERILNKKTDFTNGLVYGQADFLNFQMFPEDILKMIVVKQIIDNQIKTI